MPPIAWPSLGEVAETLLIPLYQRALEAQRPDALVKDDRAVALVSQIDYDFSRLKLQPHDQVGIILRLREFDRHARDFLARNPRAVVVHIGCGLDTRFQRVDDGQVEWYDLDLPAVIELRRTLLGLGLDSEGPRYHLLACSVFDSDWLAPVSALGPRPILFLAEGVLCYFPEAQVKSLVLTLLDHFPGAELVCDANTPLLAWLHNFELILSKMSARLRWGLRRSRDLEGWGQGIRLLDEWFYFDRPEPRLGASRWMRYVPFLGKATGVFHYRLGTPPADPSRVHPAQHV